MWRRPSHPERGRRGGKGLTKCCVYFHFINEYDYNRLRVSLHYIPEHLLAKKHYYGYTLLVGLTHELLALHSL